MPRLRRRRRRSSAAWPAQLKGRVPGHPFATGLFLGLLPCGFLYSAVVAAVARGGALEGAAALALFGLGTAPALLGVSVADEFLARTARFVNRLSQVFLLAMGASVPVEGVRGVNGGRARVTGVRAGACRARYGWMTVRSTVSSAAASNQVWTAARVPSRRITYPAFGAVPYVHQNGFTSPPGVSSSTSCV